MRGSRRSDDIETVIVAPGREHVLVRTEFPRTINLEPPDAREIARQLVRCAELIEEASL